LGVRLHRQRRVKKGTQSGRDRIGIVPRAQGEQLFLHQHLDLVLAKIDAGMAKAFKPSLAMPSDSPRGARLYVWN
jgi:hypothetical protein